MPSDASTGTCNNINATIIGKRINDTTLFGVFSFDTGKLILPIEYSNVSKISNGNFIIKKDSKMAVIDAKGKFIYNLEYDYIGYSEDTGYLLVKNNELTIKNNKKELSDIENTSINNAYSFYSWNNEDILFNGDINNNDYFTYNGTYSGKQTILYLDVCSNTNKEIYIIKNNKLEKLNANNIQKKLDNIYCA